MIPEQNEWQIKDEQNGLLFPWYTADCINDLRTWDLSDKVVLEYGIGSSTLWFAKKCKFIYAIDSNDDWISDVHNRLVELALRDKVELIMGLDELQYVRSIVHYKVDPDIIVVDGSYREECIEFVLNHFKHNYTLIIDNWLQEGVYITAERIQQSLSKYECNIYYQVGHPHWKTAKFLIK